MAAAPPRIAVTAGEPAGIGPELCCRLALEDRQCAFGVVGDPEVLRATARNLSLPLEVVELGPDDPLPDARAGHLAVLPVRFSDSVVPGRPASGNAAPILETLDLAIDGCLSGRFDAMVTAPLHKGVINDAGIRFSGHTEYLAQRAGGNPVMMLAADTLRVALVTTHLPLKKVSEAVTRDRLERVCRTLVSDLANRFGIRRPRILVAGLNPHAGEGGHLGREETDIIEPALESLRRREGMDLVGPLPADTLFTPDRLRDADAVLAMYHDQGLPVLKYAGFGRAVNITLGLPLIRTSVDHGTAFDIAGRGIADAGSLRAAVDMAETMARRAASQ